MYRWDDSQIVKRKRAVCISLISDSESESVEESDNESDVIDHIIFSYNSTYIGTVMGYPLEHALYFYSISALSTHMIPNT